MTDPQQLNPTNEPPPPPPQDPEPVVNESRRLEEMRIENENENKLPIKTYHCRFCSHLLLASTRELLSSSTPLRRRRRYISKEGGGEGGLDGALILEIPSSFKDSRRREDKKKRRVSQDNETVGMNPTTTTTVESTSEQDEENRKPDQKTTEQAHYTIPLSTLVPDPNPLVIRREDGFEKRVVLRCGRCRVIVGYELDNNLASSSNNNKSISEEDSDVDLDLDVEEGGDEFNKARKNREDRVIYLLPGSIVGTEDLEVGLDDGTTTGGNVLNAMVERNSVLKGMEREWMGWIEK